MVKESDPDSESEWETAYGRFSCAFDTNTFTHLDVNTALQPVVTLNNFVQFETPAKTLNSTGDFEVVLRKKVSRSFSFTISGRLGSKSKCAGEFQIVVPGKKGTIGVYPSSDLSEMEKMPGSCSFNEKVESPEFALFGEGQVFGLSWHDNGVYTYMQTKLEGGKLIFKADCALRVQTYGSTFACASEEPEGYYRVEGTDNDLRYKVCDFPYPIAGEDMVCRSRCPDGQVLVFANNYFRCVNSCADVREDYAVGAMENAGAGLKYVTCVSCADGMLEERDGLKWCVQTCSLSDETKKEIEKLKENEEENLILNKLDRALLRIDGVTWCVDPRNYAPVDPNNPEQPGADGKVAKCAYLFDRQNGDYECLQSSSGFKLVTIVKVITTVTRLLVSYCPLDVKYFMSDDYKTCYLGGCPSSYKGFFMNDVTR